MAGSNEPEEVMNGAHHQAWASSRETMLCCVLIGVEISLSGPEFVC